MLDQDLDLDLYRLSGKVTASSGPLAGCDAVEWLQPETEARAVTSPLAITCGHGGATFRGWARSGRHKVSLKERYTGRLFSAGTVWVDRGRDDLGIDLSAVEWQRSREPKAPAACSP